MTTRRVPGWIASALMILFTKFWTFWGAAEMYHEGWWGAWYNRLFYLAPIAATLLPTLVSFRWPRVGGSLLIAVGAFAWLMFGTGVAAIGLLIALVGGGFLVDGLLKRRNSSQKKDDPAAIYYWTADAYDERRGYFVAFNGMVNATSKRGGNPRHSYRCVREP